MVASAADVQAGCSVILQREQSGEPFDRYADKRVNEVPALACAHGQVLVTFLPLVAPPSDPAGPKPDAADVPGRVQLTLDDRLTYDEVAAALCAALSSDRASQLQFTSHYPFAAVCAR